MLNRIYLVDGNESLPPTIEVNGISPSRGAKISIPGMKNSNLKWNMEGQTMKISIPAAWMGSLPSEYAFALKVSKVN